MPKRVIFVVVAICALLPPLFAQRAWVNPAGGAWQTAGNWSPSGTPAAGETITHGLANATYTLTLDDATADGDLGWMSVSNIVMLGSRGRPTLLLNFTNTAQSLTLGNAASGLLAIHNVGNHNTTGSVRIANGRLSAHTVYVGHQAGNGPAVLQLDGGRLDVRSVLYVGLNGNASGRAVGEVRVHGGCLTVSGGTLTLGSSAIGHLLVTGGVVDSDLTGSSYLTLGVQAGSLGSLTMINGVTRLGGKGLLAGGNAGSTGAVWLAGGTLIATNAGQTLIVGNYGRGQLTVSNGWLRAEPAAMTIGSQAGSDGNVAIHGGLTTVRSLSLGANAATATGSLLMTSGTLAAQGVTSGDNVVIGHLGKGQFTVMGGAFSATNPATGCYVGHEGGGWGRLDVSGGIAQLNALTVGSKTNAQGVGANGAVLVSGGGVLELAGSLTLGAVGCLGVLTNRDGGTLRLVRQDNPTLLRNAGEAVVTNATVEFKDASGAELLGGITNLRVQANSTLRLNHSSNSHAGSASYGVGDGWPYAGLELANDARWQGTTLTVNTHGWLLATNGAATFGGEVLVLGSGYLRGDTHGTLLFEGDFRNRSTNPTAFDLSQATVVFTNGSGTHVMESPATRPGAPVGVLSNAFKIGTLRLAPGDTLLITGAVDRALVVGVLDIGGIDQLAHLQATIDVYYDQTHPDNAWLAGQRLPLTGGGWLAGQPSTAPETAPDMTFALWFDALSVTADFAGGSPTSTTFTGNLTTRPQAGFNGKNAFHLAEGETLKYNVAQNIDHQQGTLTLWLQAANYDPSAVKSSDTNKSHKSFAHVEFANAAGTEWVRLYLYQYYDAPIFYFYWHNSHLPSGGYKLASASAATIRQQQWFQLAATWDRERLRLFLNGELQGETPMPPEAGATTNLLPAASRSYLGIRHRLWPTGAPDIGMQTLVDDVMVYSRALSSLEIRRQFARAVGAAGVLAALPDFDIQLDGVDDAVGPLDRLRAMIDYHPLAASWRSALTGGTLTATSVLTAPDGFAETHSWVPSALSETRFLSGVTNSGTHRYTLLLRDAGTQTQLGSNAVIRPDTAWFGNGLGEADSVPPPWTPLTLGSSNTVGVWGRTIRFGDHPLPRQIIHTGDALLNEPPEWIVTTAAGDVPIVWQTHSNRVQNSAITFFGSGAGAGFTLDWTTRVDFDGCIRCDFVVHGQPSVTAMRLQWCVARPFADYVLAPLLQRAGDGEVALPFPTSDRGAGTLLWLTSDAKGFCWAPEDDANWIYDPATDRPIRAVIDGDGGRCTVTLISRPAVIPEGAAYHALFMATPSRPLPRVARTYRLGGYGSKPNCDVALDHHSGQGTKSIFTLAPGPRFADYVAVMAARNEQRVAIYGAATAINDYVDEGRYFGRYWSIPNVPGVPFVNTFDAISCMQISACPRTRYSDYILANIRDLFQHPLQRHCAIYYDLADNHRCSSEPHGCAFTDAFGRAGARFTVMAMRRHLMRTVRYCHEMGRDLISHAHSYYNPFFHGLSDYWYPGEQYCTPIQQFGPYYYTDILSNVIYRSELNMRLRGSGISFLGNLQRANLTYGTAEQTLAMCTPLMLHDIPISMAFEDKEVIDRIWGAALRYDLDHATPVFYHDAANRVISTNPLVKATYFRCPDNRVLLVLGNLSTNRQTTRIDLRALNDRLMQLTDEYGRTNRSVLAGVLETTLPARQFELLGFRAAGGALLLVQ